MTSLIEVKGLKKNFGKLEVLKGINQTIEKGDVVVTLSAGDANKAAPMALELMKNA